MYQVRVNRAGGILFYVEIFFKNRYEFFVPLGASWLLKKICEFAINIFKQYPIVFCGWQPFFDDRSYSLKRICKPWRMLCQFGVERCDLITLLWTSLHNSLISSLIPSDQGCS